MSLIICEGTSGEKWTRFSFGYSTEIVDVIRALPTYQRYFVSDDKMWRVNIGSVVRLRNLLEGLGHDVKIIHWAEPFEDPEIAERLAAYKPKQKAEK